MFLNKIKPGIGSVKNKVRVGRGMGSGLGKTCGRGHKGQKSRSGGFHKVGFEGGQMPIQRRLPKRGFSVLKKTDYHSLRLRDIKLIPDEVISIDLLKKFNIISDKVKKVKIYGADQIDKEISLKGFYVSKGAKVMIEASGGKIL
ncbi:50S ribosomal protein L15 [Nitrosomonas ureae]|uniref:Large ribosomal subunit protein uL15 n=1 Tax=Nitrosomonas ureae TaxID=44577 RepID=A0A1H9DNG4_9PROT|nr:50S ribosomal protein L15 [Nitrosomonas ureae]PXX15483.1 LSU ribosomal protein L15P [Nitrosomonas ureae]SEQ14293.1 large subunit ribosomal protein L15 [Nitrosomonas ureae]